MHTRLEETITAIERERARLVETLDGIDPQRLSRRPGPDRWSGVEILEHVAATEAAIVGRLCSELRRAKAAGLEPERSEASIFATLARLASEAAQAKFEAPPYLRPSGARSREESMAALGSSRTQLLEVLAEVDGYDLEPVGFPHPAFGELNAYQWVAFIALHMRRHTDQIVAAVSSHDVSPDGSV